MRRSNGAWRNAWNFAGWRRTPTAVIETDHVLSSKNPVRWVCCYLAFIYIGRSRGTERVTDLLRVTQLAKGRFEPR